MLVTTHRDHPLVRQVDGMLKNVARLLKDITHVPLHKVLLMIAAVWTLNR